MIFEKPIADSVPKYYQNYISKSKTNNLLLELEDSLEEFKSVLKTIPTHKENYCYAPGKWTTKELLLHICDTERILAYRALRFARADKTTLSGFDENAYIPFSFASKRTLNSIVEEFEAIRISTLHLYKSLNQQNIDFVGIANEETISVRTIGFAIIGHQKHHIEIIKRRYLC